VILIRDGTDQVLCRRLTRRPRGLTNLPRIDVDSSCGWMGLPWTLVDMIIEYLKTDWNTLLSCSLTCRALFYPASRAIHQRLYVAGPGLFPSAKKLTEWRWAFNRRYLRIVPLTDDADLIQYTRHLTVEVGQILIPRSLRPFASTFHQYVSLTSLTITRFDPTPFLPQAVFDHHFHHLSHSLRSIGFLSPQGTPDAMADFISRFWTVEDVAFNPVMKPPRRPQNHPTSSGPRPWFKAPLGGALRIANTDSQRADSLEPLLDLLGVLRFRSLEFTCSDISTSGIIRKCFSTLESVRCTLHCRKSTPRERMPILVFTVRFGPRRVRGYLP